MEEFYRQKIVWKAVGRNLAFSLLEEGSFLTAPASFITSKNNLYILGFLCSAFTRYYIYNNSDTTGAGDIMLNIQSLEKIPIPKNNLYENQIIDLVKDIIKLKSENKNISFISEKIDDIIYKVFNFTEKEIEFIQAQ